MIKLILTFIFCVFSFSYAEDGFKSETTTGTPPEAETGKNINPNSSLPPTQKPEFNPNMSYQEVMEAGMKLPSGAAKTEASLTEKETKGCTTCKQPSGRATSRNGKYNVKPSETTNSDDSGAKNSDGKQGP